MTADHFYLPRIDQRALVDLLRAVPPLVEDLAISITRQDRPSRGGLRISTGDREQPLPYNEKASEVADELHQELARWVRHVCEERSIDYDGTNATVSIARWLDRHIVSLAMTEGADSALIDIRAVFERARRATDSPPERSRRIDDAKHIAARNTELHRDGIAKAARELGEQYAGLTAERVNTLRRKGAIHAVRSVIATRAEIFILGEVLDAHLANPRRSRRIGA
ncbi:hypothetical protein JOJ86_005906 [Rhodococcus percolatus]|uniref:hypothetical protein n=1 Tax=Rhodococcus opacus TaxID=37919 RepID=UPI001AE661AE|nr:hypothetical protein [Rhodococcus opacus]MBP2208180.1 hypothetical protein [Rhodococcus opacus]